jgi:hypothetical protein
VERRIQVGLNSAVSPVASLFVSRCDIAVAGCPAFARKDSIEETWRIVQPLLDRPPDARLYPRASWGPEEAKTLLRSHPRWQQPWLPEEG